MPAVTRNPVVRMILGGFGACAAAFNLYESCLAGYQPGKVVWMLTYAAWVGLFAWGLHGYLLGKLRKN